MITEAARGARAPMLGVLVCLLAAAAMPQSRDRRPQAEGSFDYYLLSLSYAPDFCAQAGGYKDARECGSGRKLGFVVHGLWPQLETGRSPQGCGPARPVSQDLLRVMLNYIPSESLIQHEWTNHGTCSGLASADYFAAVRKARDSVAIPADLKQPLAEVKLQPREVEAKFAAANSRFPKDSFRVTCYRDGDLEEVRVCFTRDLSPRACAGNAGSCPAASVVLLAPR